MVDGCGTEQVRVLLRFLGLEHHAMQLEREEVRAWVMGGGARLRGGSLAS